jgi:hypothetical protein
MLRPDLRGVVDGLLASDKTELTLDAVAEAIGVLKVSAEEIGAVFDALEAAGRRVMDAPLGARESLSRVLRAARELKQQGRAASPPDIAAHAGISLDSVHLALLFAQTLTR